MADRAGFSGRRGPRGSSRGGPRGGGRGGYSERGGPGGGGGGTAGAKSGDGGFDPTADKPKRENILDLNKYIDKDLRVKFNGGREVKGVLKGFDQLLNLVLDDVVEYMQDENGDTQERKLGLLVARGTMLMMIAPTEGEQITLNPFYSEEE